MRFCMTLECNEGTPNNSFLRTKEDVVRLTVSTVSKLNYSARKCLNTAQHYDVRMMCLCAASLWQVQTMKTSPFFLLLWLCVLVVIQLLF